MLNTGKRCCTVTNVCYEACVETVILAEGVMGVERDLFSLWILVRVNFLGGVALYMSEWL